jgi:hypothetical protein
MLMHQAQAGRNLDHCVQPPVGSHCAEMRILHSALFLVSSLCISSAQDKGWAYLDNGQIRLGVNLDAGACIGWFSQSGSKENVLNAYDVGRYVQQSYYGDEDGSDWNGKPWRYNPVQGGSWRNEPAQVVESKAEENSLYAKTHPRHWATGKLLKEVTMEQWLRLEGKKARLRFRMTYAGDKEHRPHHQELPAVFVTPKLDTLAFADRDGAIVHKQPGFPNEYETVAEPWVAWVNQHDWGLGILCPHTRSITCYRVRAGNKGDCSYLAPLQTFPLKPGLVFEYEIGLMLGSIQEIQAAAPRMGRQP